jgi:hypothetical protein
MARSEARLAVSIWKDPDFLALPAGAQRLFMFLISQPDLAHDGVLALRERRWSKTAAGLTAAEVSQDLDTLAKARFVVLDEDTEELLIRSFIRRDKVYRQPNVMRSAADHIAVVSSPIIRSALLEELLRVESAEDIAATSMVIVREVLDTLRAMTRESNDEHRFTVTSMSQTDGDSPRDDVSAGENPSRGVREGLAEPQANPSAGTPGERGVVTAVTTSFPSPLTPFLDPPDPPAGAPRAGAGARETPGTAAPPAQSPPPERCEKHTNDPDPPPCGPCGRARAAREAWDRDQADAQRRADLERRSAEARQRAETSRMAIAACRICDDRGYLPSGRQCTHDPNRTASNGAAAARAAIRRPSTQERR